MDMETVWLSIGFGLVALLYAAVGQAGASGYIALMSLQGFPPSTIRITALTLNLLVAGIGTALFFRRGLVSWKAVYPFMILGLPLSVIGGMVELPEEVYNPVVGVVLIVSAFQMAKASLGRGMVSSSTVKPPLPAAIAVGAVIGFISGTTGTGGGVFLAPVILAFGWATARQTAATTAVYNLLASAAALAGASTSYEGVALPSSWWIAAVVAGGGLGAFVGSRFLSERILRGILALLLLVSGIKLVW
ncbi:sulfite exporter TauE/SafE family protein [Rhizobium sp. YJ-22]|uniref:sulfite exporter TauE/SafE family protein n=1 Tax=Rhizobium sp. YJ-22 TaxID=3037556 RepID=UPI002412E38E|nr:sulfite exporter TauE/SafE family protein [Rhizobium sp. YJ-22]MDG3576918.1 sulfite exporter TauE/SafE family protein [Rhizobium sp. YJ-22]